MKQRLLSLLLAAGLALGLTACGPTAPTIVSPSEVVPVTDLKIGLILLGDKTDAYNQSHITELTEACENLGVDYASQVLVRDNVIENESCIAAIEELADKGCHIVFTTSSGHETYMQAAADGNPRTQFCQAAGLRSSTDNRKNTHTYFSSVHEARYLSGIAAGLATKTDLLGYVAGKPIPEVISSFTAFYLGAKSVNPNVEMLVHYTNTWSNADLETRSAQALIDQGCDVLSNHTSTSAAVVTAETNGVYAVGYSQDMTHAAPNAALTSVQVNWSEYYEYALSCMVQGEEIPQDWSTSYSQGGCFLSPLNTAVAAAGTQDTLDRAAQGLSDGSRQVFAGPLRGVNEEGERLDLKEGEYFEECRESSTPTFTYLVDGITVLP